MQWITYSIENDASCTENVAKFINRIVFNYPCTSIFSCKPYNVSLKRGTYLFEVWGANGGDGRYGNKVTLKVGTGGRGAFVSGILHLKRQTTFYLYIGGHGEDQKSTASGSYGRGGYNGGADGGAEIETNNPPESSAGGGGSSDVRLIHESEGETISLKSRIIVSGAGGGACSTAGETKTACIYTTEVSEEEDFLCTNKESTIYVSENGGAGGKLHGYRTNPYTFNGNQTKGSFGKGGKGLSSTSHGSSGGGGSGYFGGTADQSITFEIQLSGAGGSSYVSGCKGCRSVKETSEEIETTDNPNHYSNHIFTDIIMKSGLEKFYSPTGEEETGHTGNGAISITYFSGNIFTCAQRKFTKFQLFLTFYYILYFK